MKDKLQPDAIEAARSSVRRFKPQRRVGRSRRGERQKPMTVRLRPLIKPDGRISRIRLSEPLHRRAFGLSLGIAIERVLELPKLLRGCYLLRASSHFFTPLARVRTSSAPWRQSPATVVTMNASDFQPHAHRLTGRPGLCGRLNF